MCAGSNPALSTILLINIFKGDIMANKVEFETQGTKHVNMSVTEDGSVILSVRTDEGLFIGAKILGENFLDKIDLILQKL